MILANARILTFDAADRVLDNASVEILPDGTIGAVGTAAPGTDCRGKLLMPALINCHTHLYSTLARGFVVPGRPPRNFPEILQKLWWKVDRALTPDDIYYSALVGLIDSARSGVGTLIDHHSSPNACAGSLDLIERAFTEVGLRGASCYETSNRNGVRAAREGIRENVRFLERTRGSGLVRGAFGLHAAFTLSDKTLRACVEANRTFRAGFHIHVAEDVCDAGAVKRLDSLGILDERTLAAHCVHATSAERKVLARRRVNVIHNPQSNRLNGVGAADLSGLFRQGLLVGLGSDGCSPRMWDECQTALTCTALRNNRAIVRNVFGMDVGRIETGANADLALIDYDPPTPMSSRNLFGHIVFGIAHAPVDSLIVNGRYVLKERQCVNLDERRVADRARALAAALFERIL